MKTTNLKKLLTVLMAFLLASLSNFVYAKGDPGDPSDDSPLSANLTINSNWVWRGLAQTDYQPAIQGGVDYAHETGFYIGNWNSTTSWVYDGGYAQSSWLEVDLYAGFKKELIAKGFATDIGFIQYFYPTKGMNPGYTNPNTSEIYIAQEYAFGSTNGSIKFYYAPSNSWGFANSEGSFYPEFNINHDTGFYGIVLNAHVGYQEIKGQYYEPGQASYSYADWLFGVTKDLGYGFSVTAAYVGTNVKEGSGDFAGTYAYVTSTGGNAGRNTGFISLTKTF